MEAEKNPVIGRVVLPLHAVVGGGARLHRRHSKLAAHVKVGHPLDLRLESALLRTWSQHCLRLGHFFSAGACVRQSFPWQEEPEQSEWHWIQEPCVVTKNPHSMRNAPRF